MSSSLTLNGIDLTTLSDIQLKQLCLKYQIITTSEVQQMPRDQLLREIKSYLTYKIQKYKGRRLSQPNIVNVIKSDQPKSTEQYNRDRRMSQPITPKEIHVAKENHQNRETWKTLGSYDTKTMEVVFLLGF